MSDSQAMGIWAPKFTSHEVKPSQVSNRALEIPALMLRAQLSSVSVRGTRDTAHLQ